MESLMQQMWYVLMLFDEEINIFISFLDLLS